MQSSNDQSRPRRTCASAILRLVGDFARIVAAVAAAQSAPLASRIEPPENILHALAGEQRDRSRRCAPSPAPSPAGSANAAIVRIDRNIAAQRIEQIGKRAERT